MIQTIANARKVSRIYHLADIHIRLFKRKEEYSKVFENLYAEIRKDVDDESIIVIAGDIAHSKSEMSPEMIDMMANLLTKLADIAPTIIIPGNHDSNLNNAHRLDAITPIVKHLDNSNIIYLSTSGLYRFDDVLFSVMSIFDKQDRYIKAEDIPDEYDSLTKIALYHGVINNAVLDTGYRMKDSQMSLDFFDGFDIALIGDIHKYQLLQSYGDNLRKPTIAYPGSLIQQNHGESVTNHGILVWDIANKSFEHRNVKNEYGFVTFEIKDAKIISGENDVPEKPRIRLKISDTTSTELKELLVNIRKKYTPEEVSINRMHSAAVENDRIEKIDLSKIRDVQFQNRLIEEYLKTNFNIDEEGLKKVFTINKKLNAMLPIEDITRNVLWKPKVFQFANMFSYGEGNIIDFGKIGGIAGLFSSNASGKSAMLEALSFCLFDKCSKSFKANNILNNRKNNFWCELNFEIDGIDYFIKKVATKSQKTERVSVKIDFWKSTPGGEIVDLNGDQRKNTSSIMQSYVGSYEDFSLTTMCTQNDPSNFIDLGQSDRKDLIGKFMDIIIFDKLYEIGTNEVKELSILIKQFEKRDFDKELVEAETALDVLENELRELEVNKKKYADDKKDASDSVVALVRKLIDIDKSIIDIDSLLSNKAAKELSMQRSSDSVKRLVETIDAKVHEYELLKNEVAELSEKNVDGIYNELMSFEKDRDILQQKIDELKIHVNHKLDKIEKLGKLEYDSNCKYCMNNIFVKDAISTKRSLEEDKKLAAELMQQRMDVDAKIKEKSSARAEWKQFEAKKNSMKELKMVIVSTDAKKNNEQSKIVTEKSDLDRILHNIELYYKSKKDIESNKKIEEKISTMKIHMASISKELEKIEKQCIDCNSKILFNENRKNIVLQEIQKAKEVEDEYYSYQYYLEAIKRDSIPYDLITKIIPTIESEANNILNQMVDFVIMLDVDNKNINCRLVYDESKFWPLDLASGMEKFIAGIAMRVALINISNLPRPNFLAIDEGFSSLDAENAANLPMILDYLKSQFDFTIVISHMDYMRDFVDVSFDLKKEDDFSKIVYK